MYLLVQNLRSVLRRLSKTAGFSLTVIFTLALGIGATTAVFSLVDGILLRPLPFSKPDRLVLVGDRLGKTPATGVTAREIGTYSKATHAFSSLGGYAGATYDLSGGPIPEQIHAARLTASVFPTLAVQPILGRIFTAREEDTYQPVAVLSYALWQNRYHRDPNVVGRSIELDRRPYTIIGVMPRSFEFPLQTGHLDQTQLWVPMSLTPNDLSEEQIGFWGYEMVGRLRDGVTVAQAAQDTDRVAKQIMRDFPVSMSAIHIQGGVRPLREYAVAGVRPLLRTLFFAVSIVLLISCVNVAGLLLVRAIRHRREYAVRLALGARSATIIRESVFEGLMLSLMGGLMGLAIAEAAIHFALRLLPESMPRIDSISMNGSVVAFALLLALATGVLCSLAPAFAALRTNLTESLKDGASKGAGASSHSWLRSTLVVMEIAVSLVLLTTCGAFVRSFQKMRDVDPGFRPDHVLVASYKLPLQQYPTDISVDTFHHNVIDRLSGKPGIVAVGITDALPATGRSGEATYTVEGVSAARWKLQFALFTMIYGDYFRAMGIPLLEGRTFTMDDRSNTPLVMIVNQSMAKHCWPGQRAIGKRMHVGNPKKGYPWATVVGVVADTDLGSRDQPRTDQFYTSARQPAALFGPEASGNLTHAADEYITVRSSLPPEQMIQTLRSTVAEVDPLLPLQQVQPMDDVISNVEAPRRFNTGLITAFAVGALLLAVIGIYAVVSFSVSLRTQEIAIRMAVGAQRIQIARLILISAAKMALIGCCAGVLVSLAVSRLIRSFLFGVSATDALIYITAVLIMMLLALLASALPATRAASADPIDALRSI